MREIPAGDGVASFLMAETEVTQELYEAVMGSNPSDFTGDDQRPVEKVSWEDAIVFCNTLSGLLGLTPVYQGTDNNATMNESANGFRLPFESEWEWAARGGQNFTYAGSDNLDDVGWYDGNSGGMTHPVGQKQANGYGLFDLSGNVWEWTNDDYDNPGVYRSGAGGRVIRGGGWRYGADYCELSRRHWYSPDYRVSLGLRFSRSL
jgi:formylglycine-generating enzyme required for sulfatase activity